MIDEGKTHDGPPKSSLSATTRYCVDCKHYDERTCRRPVTSEVNLVTGKRTTTVYYLDAEIERHTPGAFLKYANNTRVIILCGWEGKFYAPKEKGA